MPENDKPKNSAGFGNPLLAGCEPRLLVPIEHERGTLTVIPIHELQLHAVLLDGHLLAMHANGYSVHNLAERIVKAWDSKGRDCTDAVAQLKYIRDCGGTTTTNMRLCYRMYPEDAPLDDRDQPLMGHVGGGFLLEAYAFGGVVEVRAWLSEGDVMRKTFLGSATAHSVQHAYDGDMACSRDFPASKKDLAARMALKCWALKGEEQ